METHRPPIRRIVITRAVLAAATLGACAYFAAATPYFWTVTNLLDLLNDLALAGIVALPATFLVMAGQVDLSVGSGVALTGVVLAITAPEIGLTAAIGVAIGTGLAIGAVNALLVTVGRVNSVAATIGTAALVRALAALLPAGLAVVMPGLRSLGSAQPFWGIALPTLIFAGLAVGAAALSRSGPGRRSRMVGRLPGDHRLDWPTGRRWIFLLYLVSGLAAGLAGLLNTSQLGVGLPTAAIGLELTVLTAVLLGGGHLAGGRGSVAGTVLALALMSVIDNGLSLENLSAYINQVVTAGLFVVALVIDGPSRRSHPPRTASPVG
jgi:ribose transport system permease protein